MYIKSTFQLILIKIKFLNIHQIYLQKFNKTIVNKDVNILIMSFTNLKLLKFISLKMSILLNDEFWRR